MSEDTQVTVPTEKKPKIKRGIVNQKHVENLDKASLVVTAAKKPGNAASLAGSDIDTGFLVRLETDIAETTARIGRAGDLTTDVRVATEAENKAQEAVISAVRAIQAAAKQKYRRSTPQQKKDYFVGEKVNGSRSRTLLVADAILEKLKTDTLPGVSREKVANLKSLRDAYASANAGQGDVQFQATRERNTVDDAVKSITDRRVQIQFAADGIWLPSDKANAPVRREFLLPADRPFIA